MRHRASCPWSWNSEWWSWDSHVESRPGVSRQCWTRAANPRRAAVLSTSPRGVRQLPWNSSRSTEGRGEARPGPPTSPQGPAGGRPRGLCASNNHNVPPKAWPRRHQRWRATARVCVSTWCWHSDTLNRHRLAGREQPECRKCPGCTMSSLFRKITPDCLLSNQASSCFQRPYFPEALGTDRSILWPSLVHACPPCECG